MWPFTKRKEVILVEHNMMSQLKCPYCNKIQNSIHSMNIQKEYKCEYEGCKHKFKGV